MRGRRIQVLGEQPHACHDGGAGLLDFVGVLNTVRPHRIIPRCDGLLMSKRVVSSFGSSPVARNRHGTEIRTPKFWPGATPTTARTLWIDLRWILERTECRLRFSQILTA